jgi:hypothetical protein
VPSIAASVRSSPSFSCLDVGLHQLGDDLVLGGESGLELLDASVVGVGAAVVAGGAVEGLLCPGEDLVDPGVDQAGLEPELFGQLGDGLFAGEVSADDLGLLFGGEVTLFAGHEIFLRSGYATRPATNPISN